MPFKPGGKPPFAADPFLNLTQGLGPGVDLCQPRSRFSQCILGGSALRLGFGLMLFCAYLRFGRLRFGFLRLGQPQAGLFQFGFWSLIFREHQHACCFYPRPRKAHHQ